MSNLFSYIDSVKTSFKSYANYILILSAYVIDFFHIVKHNKQQITLLRFCARLLCFHNECKSNFKISLTGT